jgi:hypothetical protein
MMMIMVMIQVMKVQMMCSLAPQLQLQYLLLGEHQVFRGLPPEECEADGVFRFRVMKQQLGALPDPVLLEVDIMRGQLIHYALKDGTKRVRGIDDPSMTYGHRHDRHHHHHHHHHQHQHHHIIITTTTTTPCYRSFADSSRRFARSRDCSASCVLSATIGVCA